MLIPHFYQASLLWANCVPKYCEFKKKSQIWSFAVTNPEFSLKKTLVNTVKVAYVIVCRIYREALQVRLSFALDKRSRQLIVVIKVSLSF